MATIAVLGFSLRSSWDPSGTRGATRSLIALGAVADATNRRLQTSSSGMQNLAAAAVSLAPALIPIANVAAGVGAATVAMAATSGSALGVYGAAMAGAIKRTMEMAEANKKLDPMQKVFVGNVDRMKSSWDKFVKSTQNQTLMVANDVVSGLAVGIGRLKPVVDAVHPSIKRVSQALQDWLQGNGLKQFIDVIIKNGVPALNSLLNAGRNTLAVLGIGFRTFAPEGVKVAQALERGSAALRSWAEGGGFQRWLASVQQNAPQVKQFFEVLWKALKNIMTAMNGLGPLSLGLATGLLRIVAALPPSWIQAIVLGFVAFRSAMLGLMIIRTIVTVFMALRTAILALRGAWMILSLAFTGTPLGWLVLAIGALVAGIVYLATQTRFFQTVWNAVWNGVKVAAEAVWNFLKTTWQSVATFFVNIWNQVGGSLRAAWQAIWTAIRTVAEGVWNVLKAAWNAFFAVLRAVWETFKAFFTGNWGAAWNAIKAAGEAIWNLIKTAWNALWAGVRAIWNAFVAFFRAAWNVFWTAVRTIAQGIWNAIKAAWQLFINGVKALYNAFVNFFKTSWNNFWNAVKTTASGIWNAIKDLWNKFCNGVKDIAGKFTSWIKKHLSDAWNAVKSTASKVWHEIGEIIEKAINGVISIVNGLIKGFNKITSFLKIDVSIGEIGKVNFNFAEGGVVPMMFAYGGMTGMPKNLKHGGTLGGYSPGRDSVPAILSPGEGVLTPEAVRGLGGPGFVHSANRTFAGHRGAGKGAMSLSKWTGSHDAIGQGRGAYSGYAFGGLVPVQHFAVGGMTAAALARAGVSLGSVTQGEYSNGSLSAGTHLGGGVVDIAAGPGSGGVVAALRAAGFAAWLRTPAEGFAYHIHAVLMNHPDLSPAARAQVASYLAGGNGLGVGSGGGGGGGIDIVGMVKEHVGKILHNVYNGLSPLAKIGGAIATFFGIGNDEDKGGLFGTGIGPDFGPDVAGTVGKVVGGVTGIGGQMMDMLGQIVLSILDKKSIAEGLGDAGKKFKEFGGIAGGFGSIAVGMGRKLLDAVLPDFLMSKKSESTFNPADFAGAFGSGGTQQWAGLAAQALARAGISASQLPRFLALMAAESGGNPMAINTYDSNAAAGQASRGLMQVIPSTFAAYRDPSLSNNIFDPLANMVAAANYIKARYGGQVPGSPYYAGTNNARRGWHLVGENGPEMRWFRGGERVANARQTQRELRRHGGGGGGVVFEKGCFQIDARGASVEAVREMETNLVPKLRMAVAAGVGKRS